MKMRCDSPFAKLSVEQCDSLVILSGSMSLSELMGVLAAGPEPIQCSLGTLSRFLKRAKADRMLRDAEECDENVEAFARRAGGGKVREAALAAVRDRLFEVAVESNNAEHL